ncbi:transmembrane protein 131 isoform X2 [Denticeps clupeoides]|uniref:transmembrane protein 131 isoform X2 n=1 Tax=Denticeps clupeoides TaxID=299321 RepID=UPI0010A52644|nr:transmembrane protein 131 isoform X2 [Denticeps clupeoides]
MTPRRGSMAHQRPTQSSRRPVVRTAMAACLCASRLLLFALFQVAQANKQAFIQSNTILEVLHFADGSHLQREPDIDFSSYQKSSSLHRVNCRPIRFEPPMQDFHEQPVGMPKMEKVYLHNPSSEEISLISISATTAHFHASFFQNRIIPPGGNTSFDVVFLARVVGNVENTLFINTSHHGVFTYQVFGVGIPNPYRLRPFIGARVPVNSSFSPLINIHNPYSEPLQVVEMYSSGGDLHLELPTGQQGGTRKLWEIPPFETKGVMRASFSSRDADNHTAFIRIKTNASEEDQFIILPVEVEVTSAPGIYSSIEMLDFGMLRSQDRPKQLNLHLLNSGSKDVPITSVRPTPSNDAVSVEFKQITLKAGENKYTKVASISFDPSKVKRPSQALGKITVKAKEKSYSKLEIPYQAEVLEGYLGFDHTVTLFHIRDSPPDPMERPIVLTNMFNFHILIHDISLPEEAKTMFKVLNFSEPVLIPAHESRYIFSLHFRPSRPSIHIDSNILLVTNASKFNLPVRAYTGFLEPLVLPPSLDEHLMDFSVLSATDTSSIVFVVINSNPIELVIRPWLVTGESLSMELLRAERGNRSTALIRARELQFTTASSQKTVILASGYYAAFRVTLVAKNLEGFYDGAVHITTDYEILTIPVKALIAVGTLTSSPKHIILPPSFPGKVVHQGFSVSSSFSQRVKVQQMGSLTEDPRFYHKRLKNSRDELEPKRKSKVANIYFDASLQCVDRCYVGLPFMLKSEPKTHGMAMQEDLWDTDTDFYQTMVKRWKELKERSRHEAEAVFEVNTDLQKNVQARVTAQMMWPSIIQSARQILFPLTNTNSSSEVEVLFENPADVPVYVQILPLALYPNPSALSEKLLERLPIKKLPNIDTTTLEFQVYRNQTSLSRASSGFREGPTRPYVHNVLLQPGEDKSFSVKFTPFSNHTLSSLIIVRNNLTVLDFLLVQGQGTFESLKMAGKYPGPGSSLRFKLTESLLKDCTEKVKLKEPNFTLKRTFKLENTGRLPLHIQAMEINGYACEGYGFKIVNCQELVLSPNTSKDIVIMFTPDFTASRVIRELKLVTAGGSHFVFVLNASLPYHMLASCAEALPRPTWELELYVIISIIMSSMFLLVLVTAYLEALGIWEPFKRRLSFEGSNSTMETGRPFDLREIVRNQNDANSHDNSEPNHISRGASNSSRFSCRQNGLQSHHNSNGHLERFPKSNHSKAAMQPCYPPVTSKSQDILTVKQRKLQVSKPQPQQQIPQQDGTNRLCSEDSDYINLVEAMDRDLEQPESPAVEVFQEHISSQSTQSKAPLSKGKVHKKKTQKRREEKEKRTKGKPQIEELKNSLPDNDDSSSTTTETSNPDVDASIKEEPLNKKSQPSQVESDSREEPSESKSKLQNKKTASTKLDVPTDTKSSSLELPYVTPIENRQRKKFPTKNLVHQNLANPSKQRPPQKPRAEEKVVCEYRSSPVGKLLSSSPMQELMSSSSSSEGEKDTSPPPEWDCVPLNKFPNSVDSLQQISIQTMNADPFLKRASSLAAARTCSPPPSCPSPTTTRGSYTSTLSTISDVAPLGVAGTKNKLTSLPGKNGNPTFAAVAAGYDKSPGGSGPAKVTFSRPDPLGKVTVPHTISVDSDCSDSSGLRSPITANSPSFNADNSFSAFGPNTFNLSGVFSGMTSPKHSEAPQTWSEISRASPSIWDAPVSSDSPHSWPTSSGPPTSPTSSILGNSSLWSSSSPFSSSIWSACGDSGLSSFPSPSSPTTPISPIADLISNSDTTCPPPALGVAPAVEQTRTYNPWSAWRPTLTRRSSEPWPNPQDGGN